MTTQPLLYKAIEVARLTGLSRQAIYAMAASGDIPSIRIGRSVRFPADALDGWIKRLTAEQNGGAE